ncbi:zinc finger protein Xfin [Dendroctonus ponderosae]|uniref:zinc finger protein Xfin n=1 Tax=Dendroctonus ponderosae TaxID=77166 RepID=UPI002034E610|nr:zinc finger protein Xfin [Dendroctonus ponderosae]KAH1014838.1 hypothetical protein HUJ05_012657 [Dendroctonus ponderosae]
MSDNECPTDGHRQLPVETYKCSQCNFYTNHEYYLQQHNLTHGLQALMEHHKKNTQEYIPQSHQEPYIKIQAMASKVFHCLQCTYQTDQEALYKQHVLSHSTQFAVGSYPPIQAYIGTEDNYMKPHTGLMLPASEPFAPQPYECSQETDAKQHNTDGFDSASIKGSGLNTPTTEFFKCPTSFCTYETQNEQNWKQHNVSHDQACSEVFKCLTCDFGTTQEESIKQHIKDHKLEEASQTENSPITNVHEVFRCNNCDYETNLKAFLKRHMQIHTIKAEVKDEIAEKYQCSQCNFETEHEKFLERHERSHQAIKRLKCKKCKFETLYRKMYCMHLEAHKSKKPIVKKAKADKTTVKCGECSFETSSREQLDIHKKIRHVKKDDITSSLFNCTFCKYQTNWEPCLKRHIEREHPTRKKVKVKKEKEKLEVKVEQDPEPPPPSDVFRCYDCDFTSKSKQYLILHLKRSHIKAEKLDKPKSKAKIDKSKGKSDVSGGRPGKLYDCKFRNCTFQTSIKSNYVYHLRKHQSQNPQRIMFHFCDLCDFIAKTEDNLTEHKKRMHQNHLSQVYKCNQCDFKTVFKHSLKTHSIKHKRYSCNVCDEELESAFALVKHRRSHQVNLKNGFYLCDVCGFQSKNDRSLKMHKKTHNPEFKCPDCPFQTHSKVNFQNHCVNHRSADEVTMFPCPHCSYQSRLKRNLAWHMKRHVDPSKAKIFKCPSCDYQTFTNAQLKSHLMVHKSKEEVIMLKCDFCTFETKRKSNMVQHRLRHLKDSPDVPLLSCPDCNYTTVAKRHLNKHRKTHNVNPDKMFQCTYCPYKIHRKIYLMRHMENHKTVETFGNDQWQRYTFPPQSQMTITGVTVVPNFGQNMGHNLM